MPYLTYLENVQGVISIDYIAASGVVGTADDTNECLHTYAVVTFVNYMPRRVPIFTEGSPISREYGDLGSPNFYDTGSAGPVTGLVSTVTHLTKSYTNDVAQS